MPESNPDESGLFRPLLYRLSYLSLLISAANYKFQFLVSIYLNYSFDFFKLTKLNSFISQLCQSKYQRDNIYTLELIPIKNDFTDKPHLHNISL